MSKAQQQATGSATGAGTVPAARPERPRTLPRPTPIWIATGRGYSTTIDGRDYRITKYPVDSPLEAPYGAYAEGRFIGSGPSLDTMKGRCNAHAARIRGRTPAAEPQA